MKCRNEEKDEGEEMLYSSYAIINIFFTNVCILNGDSNLHTYNNNSFIG